MKSDWKQFHGDVKEAVPPNAPTSRGKDVDFCLYVYIYQYGDNMKYK